MDLKKLFQKVVNQIAKYKYAILIAVVGIILMNIPTFNKPNTVSPTEVVSESDDTEERLTAILSKVKGAGKVAVMLTVAEGERTIYQQNTSKNTGSDTLSEKSDTVTVDKNGLVQQVIGPTYMGAIILCQGADDPKVKLEIVNATAKITGLGSDKIAVLKMK